MCIIYTVQVEGCGHMLEDYQLTCERIDQRLPCHNRKLFPTFAKQRECYFCNDLDEVMSAAESAQTNEEHDAILPVTDAELLGEDNKTEEESPASESTVEDRTNWTKADKKKFLEDNFPPSTVPLPANLMVREVVRQYPNHVLGIINVLFEVKRYMTTDEIAENLGGGGLFTTHGIDGRLRQFRRESGITVPLAVRKGATADMRMGTFP